MKSLYIFIADEKCRPETKFYFVPVGISKREQSILHRLQVCAEVSPHVYIHKCDQSTATFLSNVARQLWDGHRGEEIGRIFREYNIRKCTPQNALNLAKSYCNRVTIKT